MMSRLHFSLALAMLVSIAALGCKDTGKISESKAIQHVERLAQLADEDVEQLRTGLPRGANALGSDWAQPGGDAPDAQTVRARMEKVRDGERELSIAKSTFFAVTDGEGLVLRSDLDPDTLVGKNLTERFPDLRKALAGEYVETFGAMPELQGSRSGPDEQWLAASPLRDGEGSLRGAYVSGWSLERYAYRLEHALKSDVTKEAMEASGKIPLTYAFVFRGGKVYGAPITPSINEEALEKLDLAARTANDAVFHQQIEIDGRKFGVAARRVPKLGQDAGVALIRSEI